MDEFTADELRVVERWLRQYILELGELEMTQRLDRGGSTAAWKRTCYYLKQVGGRRRAVLARLEELAAKS